MTPPGRDRAFLALAWAIATALAISLFGWVGVGVMLVSTALGFLIADAIGVGR